MQIHKLENEELKIQVNSTGAELDSIYNKKYQLEYLWSGDPAFWAKKSPVLFPIVGTLKNNEYYFQNRSYKMGRHGFAREKEFEVTDQSSENIIFSLKSNGETLKQYPFNFLFDIIYRITGNCLQVSFQVTNTGHDVMYFSVGGHPAFKLPLEAATVYEDYFLEFSEIENAGHWPISPDGLIEEAPLPLLDNTKMLPLNKQLFQKDALVFKDLRSDKVSLRSVKTPRCINFTFTGFPYLGIWAAKNADFVCIEPWCGIADSVHSDQQLINKEGINRLDPRNIFKRTWSVEAR